MSKEEETTEIVPVVETTIVEMEQDSDKLKVFVDNLKACYKKVMTPEVDYGTIPGTSKPTLFKAGAEILCAAFNLLSEVDIVTRVEDYEKPFFDYTVKCVLSSRKYGTKVGEGYGSCNTGETRYATRRGRPSNPDELFTLKNTVLKMAEKRSFVNATLRVTSASRIFTQDVEDMKGVVGDLEDEDGEPDTAPTPKNTVQPKIVEYKPKLNLLKPAPTPQKTTAAQTPLTIDVVPTEEPESTPPANEGMLFDLVWLVGKPENGAEGGIQQPIPISGDKARIWGWFQKQMNGLAKDGVAFQEIGTSDEVTRLYCNNGLSDEQLAQIEKSLKWVCDKSLGIKKEDVTVEIQPLE